MNGHDDSGETFNFMEQLCSEKKTVKVNAPEIEIDESLASSQELNLTPPEIQPTNDEIIDSLLENNDEIESIPIVESHEAGTSSSTQPTIKNSENNEHVHLPRPICNRRKPQRFEDM